MNDADIRIHASVEETLEAASRWVLERMAATSGPFHLALAGGSTPRGLYERLAAADADWTRVHFWWGDERCVPPSDDASNFKMAWLSLLSHLLPESERVHRIPAEEGPRVAASQYLTELNTELPGAPAFDLVLLGIGDDGHTASLFPDGPELQSMDWVVGTKSPVPPEDRVSLGLPVLRASKATMVLATGRTKAPRVAEVLRGNSTLPVAMARPEQGEWVWFLDREAASRAEGYE